MRQLLEVLGDGDFHSGEELGQTLSVSRTAVWKQLSKLADLHIELESVRGRGYRIPGGFELLSKKQIKLFLRPEASELLVDLKILDRIDSTNTHARREMDQGNPVGTGYLAECQTGGRGRRGRNWVSPYGRNIYLSLAWEYEGGAAVLEGMSLAVGVAVRRAIAGLGVEGLSLKWPNDILRDQRKLGGILLEMTGDPVGTCQVIVGIGLNVLVPSGLAESIGQPWHDLSDHRRIKRNQIAAALLSELLPLLSTYQSRGFSAYREEWERHHEHHDREIEVSTPGLSVQGIARGVAENGALCVELAEGVQYFSGGEVSVYPRGQD